MPKLDYSGIPEQPFKRELTDPLNRLVDDPGIFDAPAPGDENEELFNNIARAYIKGSKLQEGLAQMNPAGFIPVEEGVDVKFAIQRVDDTANSSIITFGLFKDACDFINNRSQDIDEEFFLKFDVIDPNKIHKTVNQTFKGQTSSNDDWVTEYLEALSPFAGAMIAGYLMDMVMTNISKAPVPDGPDSAGTQPAAYHAQGSSVGVALLIELGIGIAAILLLFKEGGNSLSDDIKNDFESIAASPAKRREILEGANFNYDVFKGNRKFDDYTAIKNYALQYISQQSQDLNYDHWIAWSNVSSNQSLLRGSMSMAPMYSKKWKKYYESHDVNVFESENSDSLLEDTFDTVEQGVVSGLRDYFSTLLTVSEDNYDKTYQVYSMEIDARLMCCLLWFIGPLSTGTLENIANMLRMLSRSFKIDINNMIAFAFNGAITALLNMLSVYANKLINSLYNKIMDKLFKIPSNDWEVAIRYCIGIDWLFKMIGKAFDEIIQLVFSIIESLQTSLNVEVHNKSRAFMEVSAERRYLGTIAGLIDSVIANIDLAQKNCRFDPNEDDPQKINDEAARAAVEFVANNLPNLYPTLSLPEDVRRKFFSNVTPFKTESLELEIPGSNELGEQQDLTVDDAVFECGEGARALEGLKIGKKIADIMEGRI